MNHCTKSVALAILASGLAFAAVLQYDSFKMSEHLQAEMKEVFDFLMKPRVLSRYVPAEVYEQLGLNPSTRLMSYRWDNCGNTSKENFLINSIIFSPDPLEFPGTFSVSFNVNINTTVTSGLKGSVLLEKKVGDEWLKIPCISNIGSCTYDDICTFLNQIAQCPPEFVEANVPCKCPFPKGTYVLPKASFDVDASFLPTGDYHIQANLSTATMDGGCYDIYASFE